MTSAHLASYVAEKRALNVPWGHIANMAGCCAADLRQFHGLDLGKYLVEPQTAPSASPLPPAPQPTPIVLDPEPVQKRRGPGGLVLAVLYAIGDGYSTSLRIAALLDTSIDNVNGALRRLEADQHVERTSGVAVSPVVWAATEVGMQHLRAQLCEGVE